jgi:hypothetical protein
LSAWSINAIRVGAFVFLFLLSHTIYSQVIDRPLSTVIAIVTCSISVNHLV